MPRLPVLITMLALMTSLNLDAVSGQTPASSTTAPAGAPLEIQLWKEGPPGDQARANNETNKNGIIARTYRPAITVFLPPADKATGEAVVICPGGGYNCLEFQREGVRFAEYLNSLGIAGVVLKYRLRDWEHPDLDFRARALADAQRAIRTVRANAAAWHIDSQRIGIGGFSAGGHLSANAGTHFDAGKTDAADPIERQSSRPDFLILGYPAAGTLCESVTPQTPPAFIVHAADDKLVPVTDSTRFYEALYRNNVTGEMHVYPSGGHGFDLGKAGTPTANWLSLLKTWLASRAYEHPTTRPAQ